MAGISSDIIRGYNDTIILYLLLDKPSYGYEISKQIKAMVEKSAPIIRLLTKDGCIISQNVKSGLLLKKLSKNLL